MNAKKEILSITTEESIEAISIGDKGWREEYKLPMFYTKDKIKEALEKLDFEFDSSYGGEEGYAVYVWTKDEIIVKGCYDGSEWYTTIPRNPDKNIVPTSIGGS